MISHFSSNLSQNSKTVLITMGITGTFMFLSDFQLFCKILVVVYSFILLFYSTGEAGTNSWEMYSYGPPHMAVQKQDDQQEHTFSSYVRIRDVVLKTYLGRWTIGRSGERGSGISVLPVRYDDDDDDDDFTLCEFFQPALAGDFLLKCVKQKVSLGL